MGIAPLEGEAEADTRTCSILLLPCSTVRGRTAVGAAGGAQQASALIIESITEAQRLAKIQSVLDAAPLSRVVTGDAEGRFECLVRPGRVTALALGTDGTRGEPAAGEVLPGEVLDLGTLATPRGRRAIVLQVLDDRGVPAPGAFALVEHPAMGAPTARRVGSGIVAGDAFGDDLGQLALPTLSADVADVALIVGARWHAPARLVVDLAEERADLVTREVRLKRLPIVDVVMDAALVRDMDWSVIESVVVTDGADWRPKSTRSAGGDTTRLRVENMTMALGPERLDHGATWRALRRDDGEVVVKVGLRGGASATARGRPQSGDESVRLSVVLPAGRVRDVVVRAEEDALAARFAGRGGYLSFGGADRSSAYPLAPLWGLHRAILIPDAARGISLLPGHALGGLGRAKELPLPAADRPVEVVLVAYDFRVEGASDVRFQVANSGDPVRWAKLVITCVQGQAKGKTLTVLPRESGDLVHQLPPGQYVCHIYAGVRPVARREFAVVGSGSEVVALDVSDRGH